MKKLLDILRIKRSTRGDLVKLTIFLVVASFLTAYLYVVTANDRSGDARPFAARFENISGLEVGSDVRVASVVVGKVSDIDVASDGIVTVSPIVGTAGRSTVTAPASVLTGTTRW